MRIYWANYIISATDRDDFWATIRDGHMALEKCQPIPAKLQMFYNKKSDN